MRMNRLLDAVADGELRLRVDAIDQVELLRGLRQLANRVTMGLVLAALIVGAAMLARGGLDGRDGVLRRWPRSAAFVLLAAITLEGIRQRR